MLILSFTKSGIVIPTTPAAAPPTQLLAGAQLVVRTVSGVTLLLDADASETVGSVKDSIHRLTGIPPDCQSLLYSGTLLEDQCSLSDYGIARGTPLLLLLRLRGGSTLAPGCSPLDVRGDPLGGAGSQ